MPNERYGSPPGVEQGSHDDLMASRGFYFDLYQSQFAESPDEVAAG